MQDKGLEECGGEASFINVIRVVGVQASLRRRDVSKYLKEVKE